jgi:hypothetical protein
MEPAVPEPRLCAIGPLGCRTVLAVSIAVQIPAPLPARALDRRTVLAVQLAVEIPLAGAVRLSHTSRRGRRRDALARPARPLWFSSSTHTARVDLESETIRPFAVVGSAIKATSSTADTGRVDEFSDEEHELSQRLSTLDVLSRNAVIEFAIECATRATDYVDDVAEAIRALALARLCLDQPVQRTPCAIAAAVARDIAETYPRSDPHAGANWAAHYAATVAVEHLSRTVEDVCDAADWALLASPDREGERAWQLQRLVDAIAVLRPIRPTRRDRPSGLAENN